MYHFAFLLVMNEFLCSTSLPAIDIASIFQILTILTCLIISSCFNLHFSFFLNIYIYLFIYLFIYFWLHWVFAAAHGLSPVAASGGHPSLRCAGPSLCWLLLLQSMGSRRVGFSSCGSWALERRLSTCGARALLLRGMWDLPGPGLEPVSPALAGGFLTTVPPGKP